MKKLLFAIASFVFVAVISVNAQDVAKTETQKSVVTVAETIDNVVQEKTKIKAEELPQAVQITLASDTYRGWEFVNAYVLKDKKQYEVELKNGAENKTFKFSEDGKVVNE